MRRTQGWIRSSCNREPQRGWRDAIGSKDNCSRTSSRDLRTSQSLAMLVVLIPEARFALGRVNVRNWQCALKARIISGGGFHPDNLSIGPEADERFRWVTGGTGAS